MYRSRRPLAWQCGCHRQAVPILKIQGLTKADFGANAEAADRPHTQKEGCSWRGPSARSTIVCWSWRLWPHFSYSSLSPRLRPKELAPGVTQQVRGVSGWLGKPHERSATANNNNTRVTQPQRCRGAHEIGRDGKCYCATGYTRQGNVCVASAPCGPNQVKRNGQCYCAQGYTRQGSTCLASRPCGPYEVKSDGRCVCVSGYARQGSACVVAHFTPPETCGAHELRRGGECFCAAGYRLKDGNCVREGQMGALPPPVRPQPPRPPVRPEPSRQTGTADFVPGQLLVGFKSANDLERAVSKLERAQRSGGVSARGAQSNSVQLNRIGTTAIRVRLDFRSGGTKLSGLRELDALREFGGRLTQELNAVFAHPNWILDLQDHLTVHLEELSPDSATQNDANLPIELRGLSLRSSLLWPYLPPPGGMNAFAAWSTAKGSRDVVVAVIDTGILPNHPGIRGSNNILPGFNFITDPTTEGAQIEGPTPNSTDVGDQCPANGSREDLWHGTHVAGTVGVGRTNAGFVGVNWSVSVLPIRAMGRCGGSLANVADAVRWAAGLTVPNVPPNEHKAHVINLSVGKKNMPCHQADVGFLLEALTAARKAGTIVVAAAGNHAIDVKQMTPAGCPGVISVGASDRLGHLTKYSNYGDITVMAPGGNMSPYDVKKAQDAIWSFVAPTAQFPSGIASKAGTSMAAPHVSAAIALALAAKPELRGKPGEIEKLLRRTLAPLPASACSKGCGSGLLDAKAMVEQ